MTISFTLVILAAVAAHDLLDVVLRGFLHARPAWRVAARVTVQVVVTAVVAVICGVLMGPLGLLPAAVGAAVMVGWGWTQERWRSAGAVLSAILAVSTLVDVLAGRMGGTSGVPVLAAGAVVVLFLTESGNRITRSVLSLAGRADAGAPPAVASDAGDSGSEEELELKGGRYIGPMERILVFGLALAGAEGIIGALMAAKGIVRFPEISADRRRGGRAEEFLVGSLTSWGLAAGGVLLLWLWQIS